MQEKNQKKVCAVLPETVAPEDVAWSTGQMAQLLSISKGGFSTERLIKIITEFINGYKFIRHYNKAVSIFGSARCGFDDVVYKDATKLGYLLAKSGFAVITGGGPGVMEAANKGAMKAGGESVGLNIQLPEEQRVNQFVNESSSFHYFFTRKVMLASASQVYIFFPGGYGTMDELFEMLTLVQTKKVSPIKIILVNKRFWQPLLKWIETTMYEKNGAITKSDLKLFHLVNHAEEAMGHITKLLKQKKLGLGSRELDSLEHNKTGVIMGKNKKRAVSKKKIVRK